MKKLLLNLLGVTVMVLPLSLTAQTARVMAIHNSADPAVDTVDVWLTASGVSTKIADNLAFRQSTGFINAPAGINIRVGFAPKTSTTIADTLIGFAFNLASNERYVILAQGHVGTGFNPQTPFNLHVISPVIERFTGAGDSTSLSVVHGATDAPAVDIALRLGNGDANYLENLEYNTNFKNILLPVENYFIDLYPSGTEDLLITYAAPIKTLNLQDSAVVVFASGFLNPSLNKNGKPFGLFAALSNGAVVALPVQNTFRLQAFHNCADPAADTVDVWLIDNDNDTKTKLIPNFVFRTATPFINAPAAVDISIGVAPRNSTQNDIIYTEDIGKIPGGFSALAVAGGVLDTSKFEANPSGVDISFAINGVAALEKSPVAGKVWLNVYHGSTDAPAVDVKVKNGPTLFGGLEFTDGSETGIPVDAQSYTIDITPAGSSTVVASYTAPLTGFADSGIVVVASGFLTPNVPTGKDAGAPFGLFAVTPSGNVIALPTVSTSLNNIRKSFSNLQLYPNPASNNVVIASKELTSGTSIALIDMTGREVMRYEVINENKEEVNLNIEGLNKGMYMLHIQNASATSVYKLIKQ
jgi:hypothetical protein